MPLDPSVLSQFRQGQKTQAQVLAEQGPDVFDPSQLRAEYGDLMQDINLSGYESPTEARLKIATHMMRQSGMTSLVPMLPMMLQLKGKPYTLHNHFPFAPFFRTRMPKQTVLICGRQVSKSTSLASQGILFSNCIPHFSTLYITPLFEMIRRFSQNYVRPFIETSPVSKLFSGSKTVNSVLQRSFHNRSQMLFSYAFTDADRTRGIAADRVCYDECQDLDLAHIPIIQETMGGSDWGLNAFSGTPKSLSNTLHMLWSDSSQAQWIVTCNRCRFENVPSLDYHLLDMIGPPSDKRPHMWGPISEHSPGCICAGCGMPLNPRPQPRNPNAGGRWVHLYDDLRWKFAGYHVPQIIMPTHYANPEKWDVLLAKQAGKGNTPVNVFYNEVCGESYDAGSKIVTETELRAAANLPWENSLEEAEKQIHNYRYRVVAVDWGGGGVSQGRADEKFSSYTSIAVLGLTPSGQVDVLYGFRSMHPHAHEREARLLLGIMSRFQCSHIIHDYTGAGSLRETFIRQAGVPLDRIVPVSYTGPARGFLLRYAPPTGERQRGVYMCDKARSLNLTCQCIKSGVLRFFKYDYKGSEDKGLIRDFLNLIEDKKESRTGRDTYAILRDPAGPDDFAQAVNIGTMGLFNMADAWPDLSDFAGVSTDAELDLAFDGPGQRDWDGQIPGHQGF